MVDYLTSSSSSHTRLSIFPTNNGLLSFHAPVIRRMPPAKGREVGEEQQREEEERLWAATVAAGGEGSDASGNNGSRGTVVVTLDVDDDEEEEEEGNGGGRCCFFDLEKAVCSHGLFMMAPNRWDPVSKTLSRPLRLLDDDDDDDAHTSVQVSISHPQPRPSPLRISVSVDQLSPHQRHAILVQVRRMLRLSDDERRALREFHKTHPMAAKKGLGRIFRSPTLFEDMVKCILLCNCQWSRTLSMANALCELQSELKSNMLMQDFQPRTPPKKDLKRKKHSKRRKISINMDIEVISDERKVSVGVESTGKQINSSSQTTEHSERIKEESNLVGHDSEAKNSSNQQLIEVTHEIGNFPCPEELADLSEEFLAKRCGLGYRAKRILSFAKNVVEKKIQLEELEQLCDMSSPESYNMLTRRLLAIDGFGPFTCANVLMCMGYYHKIPSDSETIRHLKQIHSRNCALRSIDKDLEHIYGKYAPFQFLAFWIELWEFYETRFGKISEMPWTDYQLITASNMKML